MRILIIILILSIYGSHFSFCQQDRLIAWWSFDDSTANDQSGNGYDGTLVNNPKLVPGVNGQGFAYEFEGYGENTSRGSHILLPWIDFYAMKEFTISFYAKFKSLTHSAGEAFFFFGDHANGWLGIVNHVKQPQYDGILYIQFAVGGNLSSNSLKILYDHNDDNKWKHYMLKYKDGIMRAYIDSVFVGEKPQQLNIVGKEGGLASHFWTGVNQSTRLNGVIDDVRIYGVMCDETAFIYPDFSSTEDLNLVEWAEQDNDNVVLTPSSAWKGGAVWHDQKVPVKNGFTTTFEFRISEGSNKYEEEQYPGADGIAFVIQNYEREAYGAMGGGLGFDGIPNSFAIEFDTYKNYEMNKIQSAADDPNANHAAVFCNGIYPNSAAHNVASNLATNPDIINIVPDGRSYFVKIEYNIEPNVMKIWLDADDGYESEPIIVIEDIDISEMLNLSCGEFAWVGITSATGIAYEKHEILNWEICPEPTIKRIPNTKLTSGPDTVCVGEEIEYVCNTEHGLSYKWEVIGGNIEGSSDEPIVNVNWYQGGKCELTLIQFYPGSCGDTVKKTITVIPGPNMSIEGALDVCRKEEHLYSVKNQQGVEALWESEGCNILGSNLGNEIRVRFSNVGTAKLKVNGKNKNSGCESREEILIDVHKLPDKPVITQNKGELHSSYGRSYIWYEDGEEIEGAYNQVYSPDTSGYFQVVVLDENGCKSDKSDIFYFDITGVNDIVQESDDIKLYPNPTDGILNIEFTGLNQSGKIEIYNTIGEMCSSTYFLSQNTTIDISTLNNGIYLFVIKNNSELFTKKVVIAK